MSASGQKNRRAWLWIAGGLAAATVWVATTTVDTSDAELRRDLATTDYFWYHRPNGAYLGDRLAQGELPLWNPHHGLGGPFLAASQLGVLYPPNWLNAFLDYETAAVAEIALHHVLATVSCAIFAAGLGAAPVPALLSGLLFAFSVRFRSTALQPAWLYSAALMPAVFLSIHRIVERPAWKGSLALASFVALQLLAGSMQGALITALGAAVFTAVLLLLRVYEDRRPPWRTCGFLLLGLLTAASWAAPQLLPFYELLQNSVRAIGSLQRGQVVLFKWPAASPFSLQGEDWIPGTAAVLLSCFAFFAPRGPARHGTWALGTASLLCLLASDSDSYVFEALRSVPLFGDVRFPERYRVVPLLGICILAGLGLHRLVAWIRIRASARAALLAVAAALVLAGPASLLQVNVRLPRRASGLPTPVDILTERVEELGDGQPHRVFWNYKCERTRGRPAIDVLFDYEPLALSRAVRMFNFIQTGWPVEVWVLSPPPYDEPPTSPVPFFGVLALPFDQERLVLLDALSVDHVVVPEPLTPPWLGNTNPSDAAPPVQPWLDQRFRRTTTDEPRHYVNPRALPRAYFVTRVEQEPPDSKQALDRMVSDEFDLRTTVLLDEVPASLPAPSPNAPSAIPVEVRTREDHRVVLVSKSERPGIVVVTEAFYPGWEATVDGEAVRLYRANTAVRGVFVSAGEHVIEMRYRPASFRRGVMLFACATGAWLTAGLFFLIARRRHAIRSSGS